MSSKRLKIGFIVVILILAALLAGFWLVINFPHFTALQQRRTPPPSVIPGDIELFYAANTVISTINIALLIILIVIYINIYTKTRSPFTVGLLIFGAVLLVRDLTSSPLFTSLFRFRAYGLGPFEFLPGILELIALSVLLYLSAKY